MHYLHIDACALHKFFQNIKNMFKKTQVKFSKIHYDNVWCVFGSDFIYPLTPQTKVHSLVADLSDPGKNGLSNRVSFGLHFDPNVLLF